MFPPELLRLRPGESYTNCVVLLNNPLRYILLYSAFFHLSAFARTQLFTIHLVVTLPVSIDRFLVFEQWPWSLLRHTPNENVFYFAYNSYFFQAFTNRQIPLLTRRCRKYPYRKSLYFVICLLQQWSLLATNK